MHGPQLYMGELEKREREEKERAKEEAKRLERKARDAFKELLQQHRCGMGKPICRPSTDCVRSLHTSVTLAGQSHFAPQLAPCWPASLCRELGLISVKTRWKEYAPTVKTEEAYLAVRRFSAGQSVSLAYPQRL